MMGSTRSSALSQIMQIEDQIMGVHRNKKYIKIQRYVQTLSDQSGHAILEVEDPNDMGKIIKIRKNSKTAKEYLKTFKHMLNEYEVLLRELSIRKRSLKAELFG